MYLFQIVLFHNYIGGLVPNEETLLLMSPEKF